MLRNQLISLLSFRAFARGSRQDDISVNPANIQYITTDSRSLTTEGGEFYATVIYLTNTSIKVAQTREFIEFQINRTVEPKEEYIQDASHRFAAK
tara:strand:- start:589 stop:873 length:285 start_codon:yes stop_codon:yes gene_type:complete